MNYKTATKPVVSIDDTAGSVMVCCWIKSNTFRYKNNRNMTALMMYKTNLIKYKTDRTTDGSTVYASFNQLTAYNNMVAGKLDTTGTWATHIKAGKRR